MHTKNSLIVAMLVGSQVVGSTHAARTDDRRASIVTAEQGGEDRPQDRFLNSNGIRIRYVDEGDGPAVVLVHGYLGNIERHWIKSRVFADLVKDHRVVALDCRGHGALLPLRRPGTRGSQRRHRNTTVV